MSRFWTSAAIALGAAASVGAVGMTSAAASSAPAAEPTVPILILDADESIETIDVPTAELGETLRELRRDPGHEVVEVDAVRRVQADAATITDAQYSSQWGLPAISWPTSARTAPAAPLAVVDTGVDLTHDDFADASGASRFTATWNVFTSSSSITDDEGHGTAVTSVAGASSTGTFGMVGVAPSAPLLAVRLSSPTGDMHVSDEVEAIRWAVASGAKVINLSVSGTVLSVIEQQAVQDATAAGVLLVAASGNLGCTPANPVNYPAAHPEVLAVAAINSARATPCFSSRGDYVDIAAPGTNITVAQPGDTFERWEGTSFAAPHVAGAAALLAGAHPSWTPAQIADTLRASATDIGAAGRDASSGWGVLNVTAALAATAPLPSPELPPPPPDAPVAKQSTTPPPAPQKGDATPTTGGAGPGAGTLPGAGTPDRNAPGTSARLDVLEPNDTFTRAVRTATALDLRRTRTASLRASIARRADPVDIYTGATTQRRQAATITVRLGSVAKLARVQLDVFSSDQRGRARLACSGGRSPTVRCTLPASTSRFWVRVAGQAGSTTYRLLVSR